MSTRKTNNRLNSFLTLINSMIKESGLSMAVNTNCRDDTSLNNLAQYQSNMFQFIPLIKDLHNHSSNESINNEDLIDEVWYTPRQDFTPNNDQSNIIMNSYFNANRITKLGIRKSKENQKVWNPIIFNTVKKIHNQRSMYVSKVLRKYYKKINKTCKLDHMHNVACKMKNSKKKYDKMLSTILLNEKLFDEKILPIVNEENSENTIRTENPRLNQSIKSKLPRYIGNIQSKNENNSIMASNENDNLKKELLKERKKREELEKIVKESQKTIDQNSRHFTIIERLRDSAFESSKMYRQELEKLKKDHQCTVIQLEMVKHENDVLSKRLESEMQEREGLSSKNHTIQQNIITRVDQQSSINSHQFNANQIKLNLLDLHRQLNAEKKLNTVMKLERKKVLTEFGKLQNELQTFRRKCEKLNVELEEIRSKKDDNLDDRKEIRKNIAELEQKVTNILKYREAYFKKTIEFLETETVDKFKLTIDLYNRCCDLEDKLKCYEHEDRIKLQNIEKEIAKVSKIMSDEMKISTEEKKQMLNIIRNLKQVIQEHKNRINELMELNKQQQQEIIIEQKSKVNDRDEKLMCKMQMTELQRKEKIINEQKSQLNEISETAKNLKLDLIDKDALLKLNDELIMKMQMDLKDIRLKSQKEREDSQVKNKIIDDQISTIKKLKGDYNVLYTNEMSRLNSELELSQRILKQEKKRYDTVAEKLLDLTRDNEKLAYQLQKAKNQLAKYESNNYNVINVEILTELENKVIQKCKEWQTQKNILINEKNEAILAARYATEKFVETVLDFQKQIESQKLTQHNLTILVTEREKQFEIATTGAFF